jgi:hypothetical protein
MSLFAVVELCLGTVFLLGFISIYFTVCFYTYTYLGYQLGMTAEILCLLGFTHLNLPVVLQYFLCCRYLTKQATADTKKALALLKKQAEEDLNKKEEAEEDLNKKEEDSLHDNLVNSEGHIDLSDTEENHKRTDIDSEYDTHLESQSDTHIINEHSSSNAHLENEHKELYTGVN